MSYFYNKTKFIKSVPSIKNAPLDVGSEVIFAGYSNVGKSSVINAITEQKKIAKVSKTPGRTQHLVFFEVDKGVRLIDLPGYGYAKVPIAIKNKWYINIKEYFEKRKSLVGAILVIDIRRSLKEFDKQMLKWCIYNNIAIHILLNKADKLSNNKAKNALLKVIKEIKNSSLVSVQLFSSLKKTGISELKNILDSMLQKS